MGTTISKIQFLIGAELAPVLRQAISTATRSIDVLMFVWRWYPHDPGSPVSLINQSLASAVRHGVNCRVLVNSLASVKFLRELGLTAKHFRSKHLLHSKLFLIDGNVVFLGSHNMTDSAFASNYETTVKIEGVEDYKKLQDFFNGLWQL